MSFARKSLGRFGERLASEFLKQRGFTILGVNLRLKFGEIDILAQDNQSVVIVEVKLKTNAQFGHPAEMVHPHKQRKLLLLARELMLKHPDRQARIDVIAIDASVSPPVIEHFINAVVTHQ